MARAGDRPLQRAGATQSLPFLPGAARWQAEEPQEQHSVGAAGSRAAIKRGSTDPTPQHLSATRRLSAGLSLPHLGRREDTLHATQRIWGSPQVGCAAKLPYLRQPELAEVEGASSREEEDRFRKSRTGSFWNAQGGKRLAPSSVGRKTSLASTQPLNERRSVLDRSRCTKTFTRSQSGTRPLGVLDRRASQQAALDRDKRYVQEQLLSQAAQEPASPQDDPTHGRWWSRTFAPVPDPRSFLPDSCEAQLQALHLSSQNLHCATPVSPSPATTARPAGEKAGENNPVFLVEEIEEVVRVCELFQALIAPRAPEVAGAAAGLAASAGGAVAPALGMPVQPSVLRRPSFCRLICAMEGLATGPGEPTHLGRAVAHFDQLASKIVVRGSSSPGGAVMGFMLSSGIPGQPPTQLIDMPICALFSQLLLDMAADLGSAVPERPNTGEGLVTLSAAKTRLMDVLLPQAAKYAADRGKLVQRYCKNRHLRRVTAASPPSLGDSKAFSEAVGQMDSLSAEPWQSKSSQPSKESPEMRQTGRSSAGFSNFNRARRSTLGSTRGSALDGGENSGGNSLSASQALMLTLGDREGASSPSSAHQSSDSEEEEEAWQLQEWADSLDAGSPREEEDLAAKTIYRHTFAVLKGELLSSQLLEPEVMQFVAQFSHLFRTFFYTYADVPVSATEGHMTLTAFLRFCNDFDLFPDMVDFQTVQWLYHTAEGCGYVQAAQAQSPISPDRKEGTRRGTKGERGVSPLPASPHKSSAAHSPDPNAKRNTVLRETPAVKKKKSVLKQHQQEDGGVLFCGKWLKANLVWLTKDPSGMSPEEATMTATLWAMDEWLQDMRMQVAEVCSFLAAPGTNTISVEDLTVVIDFMQLEDAPSHEDIRNLVAALAPQTGLLAQERPLVVDVGLLQMAINAVGKVKERRNRAANCFMKDFSKMTRAESNALVFFRELWYTIEYKNITPEGLFREIDADSNGTISPEELTTQIRQILKFMPSPSAALAVEGPFDMLDIDDDGNISMEEFVSVMNKVKHARETRKLQEEEKHPIFLSAKTSKSVAQRSTFFGHRAFAECLVKIALEHMGYHGSPAQAEQASLTKAVWLLLYLRWKFEGAFARMEGDAGRSRLERRPTQALSGLRPVYRSPLKKLLAYGLELFTKVPDEPRPEADAILATCWSRGRPRARGRRSLDGAILAVQVDE